MSRRLRITDESYGGDRASFRGSQFFFTARKRVFRSYPAFTIFRRRYFPHRSFSITIHANWMKKKKDSTRESRIVPGGIFFARGIALLSITDATRMRSTHAHARAIRVGSFHARLSL